MDMNDFEITKREVGASITIIAILLAIGILISNSISDSMSDKEKEYSQAIKIENNQKIFKYSMKTDVGNAFVYSILKAENPIVNSDINGKYIKLYRTEEKYTRHTKRVKTGKGYTTKTYYSWDYVGTEEFVSDEIKFCGVVFKNNKFNLPKGEYIDTVKNGINRRYIYYGIKNKTKCTIFTKLKNKTISDNSKVYTNKSINDTISSLDNEMSGIVVFWIIWIPFIILSVFLFYYLDNRWLE